MYMGRYALQLNPTWLITAFVLVELLVHAAFVVHRRRSVNHAHTSLSLSRPDMLNMSYPELFIFRKSKKTGGSSMINALMDALEPLGYVPLPKKRDEMDISVRNEYVRPSPRRLMLVQHNKVTRAHHPRRRAVIADTIRDGLPQVLSYCRHMRAVQDCFGPAMLKCLRRRASHQLAYRWARRDREDEDTYIDLPMSPAHPALSTAVLRTVFPKIPPLRILRYNDRGLGCEKELRTASLNETEQHGKEAVLQMYHELFGPLDGQIDDLKRRMLSVAGYPVLVRETHGGAARESVAQGKMLSKVVDEAERIEAQKDYAGWAGDQQHEMFEGKSERVLDLLAGVLKWKRRSTGGLALVERQKDWERQREVLHKRQKKWERQREMLDANKEAKK